MLIFYTAGCVWTPWHFRWRALTSIPPKACPSRSRESLRYNIRLLNKAIKAFCLLPVGTPFHSLLPTNNSSSSFLVVVLSRRAYYVYVQCATRVVVISLASSFSPADLDVTSHINGEWRWAIGQNSIRLFILRLTSYRFDQGRDRKIVR